jgi:hypothetical protein
MRPLLTAATVAAVAASTLLATGLTGASAWGDAVYRSRHIALRPVGSAPLRSGFVENIHANGPTVYAMERYALVGAAPAATPLLVSCSRTRRVRRLLGRSRVSRLRPTGRQRRRAPVLPPARWRHRRVLRHRLLNRLSFSTERTRESRALSAARRFRAHSSRPSRSADERTSCSGRRPLFFRDGVGAVS